MVIANNEWHNNYEDEKKSAQRATTSNTANNTRSTPSTSAISSTAGSSTNITRTDTQSISISNTRAAATARNNVIYDSSSSIDKRKNSKGQLQPSMINTNTNIMDDTSTIQEQELNENENNNQRESLSETTIGGNHNLNSNSNSNSSLLSSFVGCTNSVVSIGSNSNTNSNQNTTATLTTTAAITAPSLPAYNPAPITPQALSNALQSALNATTNNVAGSGNSFFSSLGVGVSPNATLQHTANLAKQLSSSLCTLESQTHLNNSSLDNNSTATDIMVRAAAAAAAAAAEQHHQTMLDNGQAKIILHCEPNSHPFQTRTILLTPNIECKVGRLIAKSKASESNAIFDCKVLSRNHAVLWYGNDGKFWVKDTKSSNGTFINENKLGVEAAELHFGDVVKFGVDVLENSRKEVHGCIIAGVKLYLPDGRETISIESSSQLSPHSGEGRISFDELHRLNLYMQEASQREKVLKSKLFNIQNMLDATRKNSALCWQSMVAEDQLLHRIHSLEKKLQLMEKNVPENVLRNEVIKLLDDKNSYQHSAKEALRKVYQERCDAMQMLSKMEAAYTTSDNECKLLRDQIMNTKESLQDVNARLLSLETEYNEYKEEIERQHHEAKEQAEQRTAELEEKLNERELQCEELRRKISELLLKRADLLDEEKLQQQAIEKLDAAIADMDLGDDDDEDDDDDEQDKELKSNIQKEDINGDSVVDAIRDSNIEKEKTNPTMQNLSNEPQETRKQKSTILKWLENSDLNKKEGSLDIFEAICNESDSSDDEDDKTAPATKPVNNNKSPTNITKKTEDFEAKCTKFNSKLQTVQKNLSQLEAEIANETNNTANVIASLDDGSRKFANDYEDEDSDDDDDDDDDMTQENEVTKKRNGKSNNLTNATLESPAKPSAVISKDNKSYILLKKSVSMLREAYNEICDNMKQQQQLQNKEQTPPLAISVQTQFQNYSERSPSNSAIKKIETLKPLVSATASTSDDSDEDDFELNADDVISSSESEEIKSGSLTIRSSLTSLQTIKEVEESMHAVAATAAATDFQRKLDLEMKSYQQQIEMLSKKLEQHENDAQNTFEIMQIESDAFKEKVAELTKLVDTLRDEKHALEQVISENKSNVQRTAECCKDELVISEQLLLLEAKEAREGKECNVSPPKEEKVFLTSEKTINDEKQQQPVMPDEDVKADIDEDTDKRNAFDKQMREELAAINNTAVQREEELIIYKERFEVTRNDNLKLRQEIQELQLRSNVQTQTLIKRMLPYGAVAVAILVYFIVTYF